MIKVYHCLHVQIIWKFDSEPKLLTNKRFQLGIVMEINDNQLF